MMSDALEQFRAEASVDIAALQTLRTRLHDLTRIRLLVSSKTVETKVATAYEARNCVQHLREKYRRASAADAQFREHLRATAAARANPPESRINSTHYQIHAPDRVPIIVTINDAQHTGQYAVTSRVVTVTYRGENLSSVVGASAKRTATILLYELVHTRCPSCMRPGRAAI